MIVPPDSFQCTQCSSDTPTALKCEACWGAMHLDCSQVIWVTRVGQECAHTLCNECANWDEEGEQ